MGSFSSALSGLNSASVDLSVISNDLANMNTVGYKSTDANFQDLFYQQIGSSASGNPEQVGSGVTVGSISSNFTEGTISATGVPTDVAINGQGFFVVNNDGEQEFTRAGNFSMQLERRAAGKRRRRGDGLPGGQWRRECQPERSLRW